MRVALVTGTASGIGRSVAMQLAKNGARVAAADCNRAPLEAVVAEITQQGGEAVALTGDLQCSGTAAEIVNRTMEVFGQLDVLVNSAGIDLAASLAETSEEDWDRVMAVNAKSVFLMCQASAPYLAKTGGAIVNISSGAGLVPIGGRPAYCASKAAVIGLTRALALELSPAGIRVNCVCPGAVDTPLLHQGLRQEADPDAALARIAARYPIGRIALAEEIARAVIFLCSCDSSYITGATLAVDGGRTLH